MKFKELGLSDKLIRILEKQGIVNPTPIQEGSLKVVLSGKDLLGIAQTGSGKTAAYSLPIIEKMTKKEETTDKRVIKTLILCPTRELAMQVRTVFNSYAGDFLRVDVVVGGVKQDYQVKSIKKGLDVLVATPGRLNDLINQRKVSLAEVETVVLDEADTMLDMGFIGDIRKILAKTRSARQTLMFSATMPKEILELTREFLNEPERVEIKMTEADRPKIEEELYFIEKDKKRDFLLKYLSQNRIKKAIIFTRTKYGADKLGKFLNSYNLKSEVIHGDKRQSARAKSLKDFKTGRSAFLIATDIAARGLDITDLPYVINYDLPEQDETYIHRIGRTGRAGKTGIALTMCARDEIGKLKGVQRLIKHDLPVKEDEEFSYKAVVDDRNSKPFNRDKFKSGKRNFEDRRPSNNGYSRNHSSNHSSGNKSNYRRSTKQK